MAKPFGDLEKRAIAILAAGGDPATSADTALANYWKWKLNPSANSHDLPAASERPNGRKLQDIALVPFGIDLPTGQYARTTISERSFDFASQGILDELMLESIDVNTVAYRLARFRPAKVYARTGAAETSVERTSRITGRAYKTYYAASDEGFTMPYGNTATPSTPTERQAVITAAIQALDTTVDLITYTPEKAVN